MKQALPLACPRIARLLREYADGARNGSELCALAEFNRDQQTVMVHRGDSLVPLNFPHGFRKDFVLALRNKIHDMNLHIVFFSLR